MISDLHDLPLASVATGQNVRIRAIRGANGDTQRLRELGLFEGRIVQVLRNDEPMICRIGHSRFGLCRRTARSILVEHTEHCAAPSHA